MRCSEGTARTHFKLITPPRLALRERIYHAKGGLTRTSAGGSTFPLAETGGRPQYRSSISKARGIKINGKQKRKAVETVGWFVPRTVASNKALESFVFDLVRHDLILYYPVFLLSRVIIFNFSGYKPRDEFLDALAPLALAGNHLDIRGMPESDQRKEAPFGHLHIVCRDFHFNQQGGYDAHIMHMEPEGGPAAAERNRRRALLCSTFADITFHYFPVLDSELTRGRALPAERLPAAFQHSLANLAAVMARQLKDATRPRFLRAAGAALMGAQNVVILKSALGQIQESDVIRVADLTASMHGALCREAVAKMQKLGDERRALLEGSPVMAPAQLEAFLRDSVRTMRAAWEGDGAAAEMLPSVLAEYNGKVAEVLTAYEAACRGWHAAAAEKLSDELFAKAKSALEQDLDTEFDASKLPLLGNQFHATAKRYFDRARQSLLDSLNGLFSVESIREREASSTALFKGLEKMHEARNAAAQASADLDAEKKKATAAAEEVQRLKLQVEAAEKRSQQMTSDHTAWMRRMDDQLLAIRNEIAASAQRERERYERNMLLFMRMCMMHGPPQPVMFRPSPRRIECRVPNVRFIELEEDDCEYDSD
ncbi:hypothetical protein KFL_000440100 [Klebsormidium nitens]|uniref:Uncharacterized protein n=1 Tax=Klebsormidium nitens TaxID=105231 RepID=A0A1Y1HVZ0_KLENI|nr:hypothetical protein KFL_000440100 [Klebsormidium nitens]|eukprot:GAQ80008.1 hypothetical protein KFL_000440100 [Klebsormidium nitens]